MLSGTGCKPQLGLRASESTLHPGQERELIDDLPLGLHQFNTCI